MGTSRLFFQFMSVPEDFLPDIRRKDLKFEHDSLATRLSSARCAQAPETSPLCLKCRPLNERR
jgi:hypothetical protein